MSRVEPCAQLQLASGWPGPGAATYLHLQLSLRLRSSSSSSSGSGSNCRSGSGSGSGSAAAPSMRTAVAALGAALLLLLVTIPTSDSLDNGLGLTPCALCPYARSARTPSARTLSALRSVQAAGLGHLQRLRLRRVGRGRTQGDRRRHGRLRPAGGRLRVPQPRVRTPCRRRLPGSVAPASIHRAATAGRAGT